MKRILIYLFCFSIIIQSMLGQFLLLDPSSSTLALFPSAQLLQHANSSGNVASNLTASSSEMSVGVERTRFIRDVIVDHLFSPSNCPSEISHLLVAFSYSYTNHAINLFSIQEKINNFIVFYSDFYRFIQIGLPLNKIIYPFHNFY